MHYISPFRTFIIIVVLNNNFLVRLNLVLPGILKLSHSLVLDCHTASDIEGRLCLTHVLVVVLNSL